MKTAIVWIFFINYYSFLTNSIFVFLILFLDIPDGSPMYFIRSYFFGPPARWFVFDGWKENLCFQLFWIGNFFWNFSSLKKNKWHYMKGASYLHRRSLSEKIQASLFFALNDSSCAPDNIARKNTIDQEEETIDINYGLWCLDVLTLCACHCLFDRSSCRIMITFFLTHPCARIFPK
jgi:hypothetical protein